MNSDSGGSGMSPQNPSENQLGSASGSTPANQNPSEIDFDLLARIAQMALKYRARAEEWMPARLRRKQMGQRAWEEYKQGLRRKGGQSKSAAKVAAARENGKRGGRPNLRKMDAELRKELGLSPTEPITDAHREQYDQRVVEALTSLRTRAENIFRESGY